MEIAIKEALARQNLIFIDVRSPGEYEEASIPGAINIPLFNDREHSQLGIIFYQMGEYEARRAALAMVAPRLPVLVENISSACGEKTPLLYCKRGGLRSLSLYQVLSLTGISAFRLKNGYKAYRRYINQRLNEYSLKKKLFVLHGLTGVGKTLILKELIEQGAPVIDLEELARHRGSVFGAVGFEKSRSQKNFDALLLQELDNLANKPYLLIEGEGKRIGNVYLPPFLVEAMELGDHYLISASLDTRVKRILQTYIQSPLTRERYNQIETSLKALERRMGNKKTELLIKMMKEGNYYAVAELLCKDYYDHFYSDSRPECANFKEIIDASDIKEAAKTIMGIINSRYTA